MVQSPPPAVLSGFILVHFHACNTPCYIRIDEVVKFHAIDTGTCIFSANSQAITCHESPDEIVTMLTK